MSNSQLVLTQPIVAKTAMQIRKPVAEVFAALIDPAITTRFWFTRSSGRLVTGQQIKWTWEMYHASTQVLVKAIEPNRRILIDWGIESTPTTVEWTFTPLGDHSTFVSVSNVGFSGNADAIVQQAIDATEGFTFLLAGLKAWLEHGLQLNLVPDRHPTGLEPQA